MGTSGASWRIFEQRRVFETLDHDLIEHPAPAHRFNDLAGKARLVIA